MELKPREIKSASRVETGTVNDYQKKGILDCLKKIGIMQHIGIVVKSCTEVALGSKIIALFRRIYEYIDQRIDHKSA